LVDSARIPDKFNPRGYFECSVDALLHRLHFNRDALRGQAVKVTWPRVRQVLDLVKCKVIFMLRDPAAITRSINAMLAARAVLPWQTCEPAEVAEIRDLLDMAIMDIETHANADVIFSQYERCLKDPYAVAAAIAEHLERDLDVDAMARVVDPELNHHSV